MENKDEENTKSLTGVKELRDKVIEEFKLKNIMNKPTKKLTNHERYLRYRETFSNCSNKWKQENKAKTVGYVKKSCQKHREKANARARTRYNQERTGICLDCKRKKKTEFHHLTYKPNIFIEVCKKCHLKRHGRKQWTNGI